MYQKYKFHLQTLWIHRYNVLHLLFHELVFSVGSSGRASKYSTKTMLEMHYVRTAVGKGTRQLEGERSGQYMKERTWLGKGKLFSWEKKIVIKRRGQEGKRWSFKDELWREQNSLGLRMQIAFIHVLGGGHFNQSSPEHHMYQHLHAEKWWRVQFN